MPWARFLAISMAASITDAVFRKYGKQCLLCSRVVIWLSGFEIHFWAINWKLTKNALGRPIQDVNEVARILQEMKNTALEGFIALRLPLGVLPGRSEANLIALLVLH